MNKHQKRSRLRTTDDWAAVTKGLLKAELVRRDISYQQLAELLARMGVRETPENLANKINRGKFGAMFLIQCLEAIDCKLLRLSDE
jgi:hypothetical protein